MRRSLVAREAEILDLLRALHKRGSGFTLIGGYAVDAYSPLPRYSADCDIVMAEADLPEISSFLAGRGYVQAEAHHDKLEGMGTRRFMGKVGDDSVYVDALVGGVRCRQTGAVWMADEVRASSRELLVAGVNGSVLSNVPSREMLIAMKLHSGRDPDLRDVVMLASRAEWKDVLGLSRRGSREKVILQLESAAGVLGGREFEGRLKAYFGLRESAGRRIGTALGGIGQLLESIKQESEPWVDK